MSRTSDSTPENPIPDTASRSGYDSTADMAQGKTRQAAGKLAGDDNMELEGEREQADAAATESEALKPWQRARDANEPTET
jgi:uncharacterized protein YjbJ (UPF0337 family)